MNKIIFCVGIFFCVDVCAMESAPCGGLFIEKEKYDPSYGDRACVGLGVLDARMSRRVSPEGYAFNRAIIKGRITLDSEGLNTQEDIAYAVHWGVDQCKKRVAMREEYDAATLATPEILLRKERLESILKTGDGQLIKLHGEVSRAWLAFLNLTM